MRVVVAAFGNELRGDDGFGIAVLRRLEAARLAWRDDLEVRLIEVGTGGLWLAQELLSPCDRLVIVDAISRGGAPGTVYVLAVEDVPPADMVDMHLTVPARALGVAKALGALPAEIFLVGCEPGQVDDLVLDLSPAVRAAVDTALREVHALIDGGAHMEHKAGEPGAEIARRDELLELLYWIEGEGFHGAADFDSIVRFLAQSPELVRDTLARLIASGDVVQDAGTAEYRLTDPGRREAARRFAEEFAPLITQGHGECSDPQCDCHSDPASAAACHAARTSGHEGPHG